MTKKNYIVLEAVIELKKGSADSIKAVMDDLKEKRVSTYEEFVFILNHTILAIGEIEEIQSGQYNYFIPYVENSSETPKIFKTNADSDSHALRLYHGIEETKDDYPVIYRIDEF